MSHCQAQIRSLLLLCCGLLYFLCQPLLAAEFFDPTLRPQNIERKKQSIYQVQELKLDMIIFTYDKKFVIINQKPYRIGDTVAEKFKIVNILPDKIIIEQGKQTHTLSMAKNIDGSEAAPSTEK